MSTDTLPWPAPTSLAGFLLGIIFVLVTNFVIQTFNSFTGLLLFLFLPLCCAVTLSSVIYALFSCNIALYFAPTFRCRDLDARGFRKNLAIALCLGGTFACSLLLVSHAFRVLENPRIVWPFGVYLAFLTFFHWSEFFITALTSPLRADIDSYMLVHSPEYLAAVALSFAEYWLGMWLWPTKATNYLWINLAGLLICIAGESLRKVAMWTAADNFSHFVEHTLRREHQLVRSGVYAWCRHPAYVGWFFWSLGTQLLLANPLCSIVYPLAAYAFFRDRVYSEEQSLVAFFGEAYRSYQREVGTGLPFIRGYVDKNEDGDYR
ncbi:unnamed protein product [Mesocestoides corti]|uniref:Protein-S-isoprenylcysteine O-methyltransferase n=1 Tax=Mesocestoides corti TaxID=53468 RepID=A0A0R3U2M6_MESCO|nr:unnamed protein product [Mesocestoides corti]